ncbi:MAG TPA: NEW3 domain-containing protein [Methanocella sp.]|nr:NEW3 domain-containing protein [Methanocella sp.]
MKLKFFLLALLALCAAAAAIPVAAGAETSYVSVYAGWVNGDNMSPQNSLGVYVTPGFPNDSLAANVTHLHIQSSYYSGGYATLGVGDSYDYYDAARITVMGVRDYYGVPQAYIDVSQPVNTSGSNGTNIYCDTPGVVAKAGDIVSFSLTIQNDDTTDRTYTLRASSPTDWNTTFQYQGKNIYQLYVPKGQSKTVSLLVDTPYTATLGEKTFTAYADSYNLNLHVDVDSVNQSVSVSTPTGDSVIASIGSKAYYDITLNNLQDQENVYQLSVTGLPANWYYMYLDSKTSTNALAEEVVSASTSKNMALEIIPAASATAGDYNFTMDITTNGVTVSKNLTLKLNGGAAISAQYDKLSYDAKPGTAFNIKVYVTNSGKGAALTNVYPSVEAPSGWTVSSSPETANTIQAGNMQVFTVSVLPPANIQASDYDVKVTVKSDQANSDVLDYRINVTTDSYVMYIAVGIVLVVIAGLVIVFRKYGRR